MRGGILKHVTCIQPFDKLRYRGCNLDKVAFWGWCGRCSLGTSLELPAEREFQWNDMWWPAFKWRRQVPGRPGAKDYVNEHP